MKRIVLTGAESTGKSTLADKLARHYAEPCTGEYVREHVAGLDRPLGPQDLDPIAKGQIAEEDRGLVHARALVFHDTNLLSSIVYARHYFDESQPWVEEAFAARSYALYLLCMPDIPWVPDAGQRESPQARAQLHRVFTETLERRRLPYVRIAGESSDRFRAAIAAIDARLDAP